MLAVPGCYFAIFFLLAVKLDFRPGFFSAFSNVSAKAGCYRITASYQPMNSQHNSQHISQDQPADGIDFFSPCERAEPDAGEHLTALTLSGSAPVLNQIGNHAGKTGAGDHCGCDTIAPDKAIRIA
ncbi:hypothetical protein [Sphingomonas sp.]|uniref:hypothetical protein n=1 Tax=Sphingomonas sp. TaxID=28214 RepID=UPI003D6CE069